MPNYALSYRCHFTRNFTIREGNFDMQQQLHHKKFRARITPRLFWVAITKVRFVLSLRWCQSKRRRFWINVSLPPQLFDSFPKIFASASGACNTVDSPCPLTQFKNTRSDTHDFLNQSGFYTIRRYRPVGEHMVTFRLNSNNNLHARSIRNL